MTKVNSHKVGLAIGGVVGIWHLVWSLLVLFGLAKPFLDWILGLHFIKIEFSLVSFNIGTSLLLIIATSVIGYLFGYVLGWLWNLAHKA